MYWHLSYSNGISIDMSEEDFAVFLNMLCDSSFNNKVYVKHIIHVNDTTILATKMS